MVWSHWLARHKSRFIALFTYGRKIRHKRQPRFVINRGLLEQKTSGRTGSFTDAHRPCSESSSAGEILLFLTINLFIIVILKFRRLEVFFVLEFSCSWSWRFRVRNWQIVNVTFNCTFWSRAIAVNISRVTVNCFPFDVTVFAMLPAQGIWRETVSLLDVMWPWTSQWMGALKREKRQLYNNLTYDMLCRTKTSTECLNQQTSHLLKRSLEPPVWTHHSHRTNDLHMEHAQSPILKHKEQQN